MRTFKYILIALLAVVTAGPAAAGDEGSSLRKPPAGSIAAQLRLKFLIKAQAEGSLLTAVNHNRQDWENLSADQRDQYRRNVLAFLNKSPEEQEQLLKHYDQLVKLSAEKQEQYRQRAGWLKAVIDRMSPQEKQALLDMAPEDRAKVLLEKREQLQREGVRLDQPGSTTGPATASAPAKS
jgi:aminopeptidase N